MKRAHQYSIYIASSQDSTENTLVILLPFLKGSSQTEVATKYYHNKTKNTQKILKMTDALKYYTSIDCNSIGHSITLLLHFTQCFCRVFL